MALPPLLCNTPPPIDFGEEDEDDSGLPPTLTLDLDDEDEFGEFSLPTKIDLDNGNINARASTPPEITSSSIDVHKFSHHPSNIESSSNSEYNVSHPQLAVPNKVYVADEQHVPPLEAFNLNVSTGYPSKSHSDLVENVVEKDSDFSDTDTSSSSTSNPPEIRVDIVDSQNKTKSLEVCSQKTVIDEPSKEVSSAYGINEHDRLPEQIESCKSITMDEEKTRSHTLREESHPQLSISVVTVEDLMDDSSDDEYRSRKKKSSFTPVDEKSEDFFAIRLDDDESKSDAMCRSEPPPNNFVRTPSSGGYEADEFEDFACFEEPINSIVPTVPPPTLVNESRVTVKLKQLSDYVVEKTSSEDKNNTLETVKVPADTPEAELADFEDFQDYREAETVDLNVENENSEDDDFGDFSEAAFTPAVIPIQCSTPSASLSTKDEASLLHASNVHQRLQPVLEIMFPAVGADQCPASECQKQRGTAKEESMLLNCIDSAKALDFQWANSEIRHTLIKSLGIDSRNILFGEKWNSSMPRFAANLSVSPLQPTKQQSNSAADNTSKSEVPAVEFDWNSSALVNPLDGSASAVQTEEAKAIRRSQSGELHGSSDEPLPLSRPQLQRHDSDGDADVAVKPDDYADASTAAAAAAAAVAATAEVPPDVSPDSIGHSVHNNGNYTDLGIEDAMRANQSSEVAGPFAGDTDFAQSGIRASLNVVKEKEKEKEEGNTLEICNSMTELDTSQDCEVMTTSTYAGPLKETHIYTPPKSEGAVARTMRTSLTTVTKVVPVDFDYEMAAAGIIIDETVVKKEYRDVEYNPGFGLAVNDSQKNGAPAKVQSPEISDIFIAELTDRNAKTTSASAPETKEVDFDDEFSDFQSVAPSAGALHRISPCSLPPSPVNLASVTAAIVPAAAKSKDRERSSSTVTPTIGDEMILSPAILLPQAISMERSKPKIEWGESAANINPEELARIEELFPQPKSAKAKEAKKETSYNSTPTRKEHAPNSLSISASIAQKEQDATGEEDDWSEFVSVPITEANCNTKANNNHLVQGTHRLPNLSPRHQQHSQKQQHRAKHFQAAEVSTNNWNDEEWSDFVSNASVADTQTHFRAVPQFNSAAWQNANFYNNPLSFYHQRHQNPSNVVTGLSPRKIQYQNNNNSYNNNNNNANQNLHIHQQQEQQQQQHLQRQHQEVHVMQDFSTAAPYRPNVVKAGTSAVSGAATASTHFGQFQVGSAKVAPRISLIPDLGFVAPGVPTHTSLIHSLSLPGFNAKK